MDDWDSYIYGLMNGDGGGDGLPLSAQDLIGLAGDNNEAGVSYGVPAEDYFSALRGGMSGTADQGMSQMSVDPASRLDQMFSGAQDSYLPTQETATPSIWDRIKSGAGDLEDFGKSPVGKITQGGLGALIAAYGAHRQNQMYDKAAQNALAAKAAQRAQFAVDTAPMRFTNQRAASPSWGPRQSAFSGNSLAAMTPRSTGTMYAAEGGAVDNGTGDGGDGNNVGWQQYADGGTCHACGGLAHYVRGGTAGQADKVPAMLSDGEYVMDASSVADLGDGNNAAGAAKLDQMRQNIRAHKRKAPLSSIPPKAKAPEAYLKGAK